MDNTRGLEEITWRQAIEQVLREAGQPMHYLEIAGRIIMSGFQTTGRTPERTVSKELTQHPDLFRRVDDGVYELANPTPVDRSATPSDDLMFHHAILEVDVASDSPGTQAPEVEEALAVIEQRAGQSRRGQGFQSSVQVRRATELHAMRSAIEHFSDEGWQVEDVSTRSPFDLMCVKLNSSELRVEVKGTTGDGSQVLLTRREAAHARASYPNIGLFILHHIGFDVRESGVQTYGGSAKIILPWDIRSGILVPLGYSYSLVE
jgi:hypothetical protein